MVRNFLLRFIDLDPQNFLGVIAVYNIEPALTKAGESGRRYSKSCVASLP